MVKHILQLTLDNWAFKIEFFRQKNFRWKRLSSKTDLPTRDFLIKNSPRSHSPSCESTGNFYVTFNVELRLVFINFIFRSGYAGAYSLSQPKNYAGEYSRAQNFSFNLAMRERIFKDIYCKLFWSNFLHCQMEKMTVGFFCHVTEFYGANK